MLEQALNYFKNLWEKFIDELYEEEILNDNDITIIQNNYINYEKDDFGRQKHPFIYSFIYIY